MTKMYRAHIVEYPEFEEVYADRHLDRPEYGGGYFPRPFGWEPDADYIERFRTEKWIEPDTDKWFKSRSSAKARVDILNDAGYVAIVQESAPVVWPADGEKSVNQNADVARALKIVRAHGFRVVD